MQDAPPDLMIEVPFKGVGLLDLDQVDRCIEFGEEVARRHLPELLEMRDTPPGRWRRWWRELRQRLPG